MPLYTPKTMIVILFCLVFSGASATHVTAKNRPEHRVNAAMKRQEVTRQAHQVAIARTQESIRFYIRRTHDWQKAVLAPLTRSEGAASHTTSLRYMQWILHLWLHRAHQARQFAEAYPWARMVKRTYAYRQCIIDTESRTSGIYSAQNRYSSASGAYQYIDSTWLSSVHSFERYFHVHLTDATRAIDALPAIQDAVAAYDVAAEYGNPWAECHGVQRLASPKSSITSNKSLLVRKDV